MLRSSTILFGLLATFYYANAFQYSSNMFLNGQYEKGAKSQPSAHFSSNPSNNIFLEHAIISRQAKPFQGPAYLPPVEYLKCNTNQQCVRINQCDGNGYYSQQVPKILNCNPDSDICCTYRPPATVPTTTTTTTTTTTERPSTICPDNSDCVAARDCRNGEIFATDYIKKQSSSNLCYVPDICCRMPSTTLTEDGYIFNLPAKEFVIPPAQTTHRPEPVRPQPTKPQPTYPQVREQTTKPTIEYLPPQPTTARPQQTPEPIRPRPTQQQRQPQPPRQSQPPRQPQPSRQPTSSPAVYTSPTELTNEYLPPTKPTQPPQVYQPKPTTPKPEVYRPQPTQTQQVYRPQPTKPRVVTQPPPVYRPQSTTPVNQYLPPKPTPTPIPQRPRPQPVTYRPTPNDIHDEREPQPSNEKPIYRGSDVLSPQIFPSRPPIDIPKSFAKCASALVCTQENYCNSIGVISETPVEITPFRVPLTDCIIPESGAEGKCCRDPNYVDPWPVNLAGVCATRNKNTKPVGVKEFDANFAEIPWQAMILKESTKSLLCGGAIIGDEFVLSSASCVQGVSVQDLRIKAGEWELGSTSEPLPFQLVGVKSVDLHPQYNPSTGSNDMAIIRLEKRFEFATHIQPICISDEDPTASEQCVTSGWGKQALQIHEEGAIIHVTKTSPLARSDCGADSTGVCSATNYDSCEFDIGSALACGTGSNVRLKGIYSVENACGEGQSVRFIKPDVKWINTAFADRNKPLLLKRV